MKTALVNEVTSQFIGNLATNSQKHLGYVTKAYTEGEKVIYIGKRVSDNKPWRSDSPTLVNPDKLDDETKKMAILSGYIQVNEVPEAVAV